MNGDIGSVAQEVERFIRAEGNVTPDDPGLTWSVDLLEAGYLDSLGIVRLIAFLDVRFGLRLDDEILLDERLATIEGIASIALEHGATGTAKSSSGMG
ncbi:phosphopantetheine-binding protein [Saccharothrix deserti]|uniref:phosphopantetheine-binding protein n=1 Tax=Saccharothrix deserti TaxID=2593674 RepID=UPI00131E6CC6|nr:phosphopantetheine-binding protein [Saccharothrix deserti]